MSRARHSTSTLVSGSSPEPPQSGQLAAPLSLPTSPVPKHVLHVFALFVATTSIPVKVARAGAEWAVHLDLPRSLIEEVVLGVAQANLRCSAARTLRQRCDCFVMRRRSA